MRSKSYALMLVAVVATVSVGVVGANALIDPWAVFGTGLFAPTVRNDRYQKYRDYAAAPDQYDSLLLSSSRGWYFPMDQLSRDMDGERFASFAVSYGRLADHVAVLEFALRDKIALGGRLKSVFLLIDVEHFGERPAGADLLQLLQPPAISGQTRLRFWWKNLIAIQFEAWARTVRNRPEPPRGPPVPPDAPLRSLPQAEGANAVRERPALAPVLGAAHGSPDSTRGTQRLTDRLWYDDDMARWRRIVALCRDNDIRLVAALSPIFPGELALYDPADLEDLADRISRIAPVWDFSDAGESSNREALWIDGNHYVTMVAEMMLARMFGGDLPPEWKNFGKRRLPHD